MSSGTWGGSSWGGPRTPLPTPSPTPTPTPTTATISDWDEFLVDTITARRFTPGQDVDAGVTVSEPSPYATDVPCKIRNMSSSRSYENDRIIEFDNWKIYFNHNYGFRLQDKLTWTDDKGISHTAFVVGITDRTATSLGGLCDVMAEERT